MLRTYAIATLLMLLMGSCAVTKKLRVRNDSTFPGIKAYRDSSQRPTNVILVHGMGTKCLCEFDDLASSIALRMGFDARTKKYQEVISVPNSRAEVKVTSFAKGQERLNFFFVHWSPVTIDFKKYVFDADRVKRSALVNNRIKDLVVNDGFADVTAYADSGMRAEINRAIIKALGLTFVKQSVLDNAIWRSEGAVIEPGDLKPHAEEQLTVVSGSFGSKIVYEALFDLPALSDAAPDAVSAYLFEQLFQTEFYWFLLSNQLPLTEKYHFKEPSPDAPPTTVFSKAVSDALLSNQSKLQGEQFENLRKSGVLEPGFGYEGMSSKQAFRAYVDVLFDQSHMVSFYDPNDMLGYRVLRTGHDQNEYADLTNVRINVARPILRVFVNPLTAHEGSKEDGRVHCMIVNGCTKEWKGMKRRPQRKALQYYRKDRRFRRRHDITIKCQKYCKDSGLKSEVR